MDKDFEFFADLKNRATLVKTNSSLGSKSNLMDIMMLLMQKDYIDAIKVVKKPIAPKQ